jgi:hypothetical protein
MALPNDSIFLDGSPHCSLTLSFRVLSPLQLGFRRILTRTQPRAGEDSKHTSTPHHVEPIVGLVTHASKR